MANPYWTAMVDEENERHLRILEVVVVSLVGVGTVRTFFNMCGSKSRSYERLTRGTYGRPDTTYVQKHTYDTRRQHHHHCATTSDQPRCL